MKTIGASEARTHFSELLDWVRLGERVTITRRGTPVAMFVPLVEWPVITPAEAAASLRALRVGVTLDGVSLAASITKGRR